MKKTLIQGISTLVLACCMTGASMAGTAKGRVTQLIIHQGNGTGPGVAMFTIEGERRNVPPCSTDAGGLSFAVSLGTTAGRAMVGLLSAAHVENRGVQVQGTHTCSAWGDRESPAFIVFY